MSVSEVAKIRRKIANECTAAQWGLSGLASGVSRHAFIEARMQQGAAHILQLLEDGKHEEAQRLMETRAWGLEELEVRDVLDDDESTTVHIFDVERGKMMSDEEEVQQRQIESMTTEQIRLRIKGNQREINTCMEHLITRATLQEYTEQQHSELLTLLQEALTFIEGVSPLPLEWVGRRNELLARLKRKV